MLSIKSKDVNAHNSEPYHILGGATVPMMYDRLAQVCMKSNAVQSSLGRETERSKNQAASNQTTRFTTRPAGQAAAAQMVATELCMAGLKRKIIAGDEDVVNPMATNAADPSYMCMVDVVDLGDIESRSPAFACTTTARLLYNAVPTKPVAPISAMCMACSCKQ